MASRKSKGLKEAKETKTKNYASATKQSLPKRSSLNCAQSKTKEEKKVKKSEVAPESGVTEHVPNNQINFFSGNPFNEITKGKLHIVKEEELTENCSRIICILSVPTTMTCQDVLAFTAACHRDIQHFKILRDGNPNQYMTLVTFRSSAAASEFYKCFNGTPYNSIEPDVVCQLAFVSKVEVSNNGTSLAELPSCPVCLDRMDENVDGILTILCNHTFHSSCLAKWCDTSCPICRYAQTPEPVADSYCMECEGSNSNGLWICLICGHVGCSRYHEAHAFEHYQDTHHCYAMQLGTNRVWDYVGENFVHRLLQDKDGKMVESDPEPAKAEMTATDEKIDSVMLEFTHSLTTQLKNQRQYFEEKLGCYEQSCTLELAELKAKLEEASRENANLQEKLSQLIREEQVVGKKLQSSISKLSHVQVELKEEKELRKALNLNQSSWETKHRKLQDEMSECRVLKESEIEDLREQVRDLMFFIEAQKQIEQSEDKADIEGGQIIVGQKEENSASSSGNARRSRRGKR